MLLFALFCNAVIALGYGLFRLLFIRKNEKEAAIHCFIILLCPFVGLVYFALGAVLRRLLFHKPVDLADVVFEKSKKNTIQKADEQERDFIPMEEALMVTDKESTRNLVLEIAKHEVDQSLSSIYQALNSDDSELSHYAATVLQSEIDKFRTKTQEMMKKIYALEEDVEKEPTGDPASQNPREAEAARAEAAEKIKTEIDLCHHLYDSICRMLQQKVISPAEQAQYTDTLEEIAAVLEKRDVLLSYEIEAMVMLKTEAGDFESAEAWSERSARMYPNTLSTYTCKLKLYYTMGDRAKFFEWMDRTKKSGISLDHETLEMIRVFL